MNSFVIPTIPLLIIIYLSSAAWAVVSLVPPSTFEDTTSVAPLPNSTSSIHTTGGTNSTSPTPTSSAQFPSLSGYPTCVTSCLDEGISLSNCTSVVDVNCFCNSKRFSKDIVNCVSSGCPQELSSIENLAQQFCNLSYNSTSLSFPSTTFYSTSTSSAVPSPAPISTTSSSASATGGPSRNSASRVTFTSSKNFRMLTILNIGVPILAPLLGAHLM